MREGETAQQAFQRWLELWLGWMLVGLLTAFVCYVWLDIERVWGIAFIMSATFGGFVGPLVRQVMRLARKQNAPGETDSEAP